VTAEQLRAEVALDFEALQQIVSELASLQRDLLGRDPTVREKTAASAFLAQFYSGVENILKRLSRFHGVELPAGENWHFDLFKRFCEPPHAPLPALLAPPLATELGAFRRFRHIVHHGYGFQIDWDRMHEGVSRVAGVLETFRERVRSHLSTV
jgi:hypothetical protein